jgi:hypothetical protein
MFTIATDTKRAYLYLHRKEVPGKGKKVKIQYHPMSLVCLNDEVKKEEGIREFITSYGVKDFTVHGHEEIPDLHLVQIHSGYPQKEEDILNLKCYREALEHFNEEDHLTGGADHIEAIQEILVRLMAEAGVAA